MSEPPPLLWHCPHCDKPGMPLKLIWRHVNRTHHECLSCQAEVMIAEVLLLDAQNNERRAQGPHGFR